jgi:hypothetical protein
MRTTLIAGAALALVFAPTPSIAGPATSAIEAPAEDVAPVDDEAPADDTAPSSPTEEAPAAAADPAEPAPAAVDESTPRATGGVGGHVTDADDPDADRARTELEGDTLGDDDGPRQRMTRLEAAGWWTMFGAIALGTAGGVFAGLAESRIDEAERLGLTVGEDGRLPLYDDEAAEYDELVGQARGYNTTAITLLAIGGAAVVTSIALFSVEGARKRKQARRVEARASFGPTRAAVEVHF